MHKSKDILKQEEELLKLNDEINSKTKDLLSEFTHIKKIQSDNEKLHSNQNKVEVNALDEILDSDEYKKEIKENLSTPKDSSEDNYFVTEYLSKIKNGTSESLDSLADADAAKTKYSYQNNKISIRRNLKLSQSAKTSVSLNTTVLGDEAIPPLGLTRHKSDMKLKTGDFGDEVIPETLRGVGNDGIKRFLIAKVKLLTEQLQVFQKEEKKLLNKLKEIQAEKDKSVEECDKLTHQVNSTRNILTKYEQHANSVNIQLQSTHAENARLKRELEALKKELRESNKNGNTNEVKLNRTLEELEKLKATIQQMKQEDKELRESHRRKIEELSFAVKKLDRQKTELLNGFKKQLLLIDNLKRQKGLIDAAKLLKCAEEDFTNFLDSNPPNIQTKQTNFKSSKS